MYKTSIYLVLSVPTWWQFWKNRMVGTGSDGFTGHMTTDTRVMTANARVTGYAG